MTKLSASAKRIVRRKEEILAANAKLEAKNAELREAIRKEGAPTSADNK